MKKILLSLSAILLCASLFAAKPVTSYYAKEAVKDTGNKKFNAIGAKQTVYEMKTGWNLGNTLDSNNGSTFNAGLSAETMWSQPKTTKEMIDGLAASGIKTIRIPVSWSNHLCDGQYSIDPEWMNRVKTIVDWCIEDGMYVILNCHHDNYAKNDKMPYSKGYYPTEQNRDESIKFLTNIWAQISLAFNKGYDEHLIFETMNEPRPRGTNVEWAFNRNNQLSLESAKMINEYNQICVDTIRASGGNNKKRCIMVPGIAAAPSSVLAPEFVVPTDIAPDQIIISVHMYTPYSFAMESPGLTEFTDRIKQELAQNINSLQKKYVDKGYPVVIGEYGATNKNNLEERVKWFEFFNAYARKKGMVCVLWDNGAYKINRKNDFNEKYGFYNRLQQTWYFPEIIDAINKGCADAEEVLASKKQ